MKQYVFEVLEEVTKARTRDEKVRVLKENESWALKDVIRGSLDSTIIWNLPEGEPPYNASAAHNHPTNLYRENKKFRYSNCESIKSKFPSLPSTFRCIYCRRNKKKTYIRLKYLLDWRL